jgi:hypothetical protein
MGVDFLAAAWAASATGGQLKRDYVEEWGIVQ